MSKGGLLWEKAKFQNGKGLPRLGCLGWAYTAAITRFGGGSSLGGHCATKRGGNSSSAGKPRFFKFLTLQHFLKFSCYGL